MSTASATFIKKVQALSGRIAKSKAYSKHLQKVNWSVDNNGQLSGEFKVEDEHLNLDSKLHSGFIFTFVDLITAWGYFASHNKEGVSVSIKVLYTGPASKGDNIVAKTSLISTFENLAFLRVDLFNKDTNDVIAVGKQTVFVKKDSKNF